MPTILFIDDQVDLLQNMIEALGYEGYGVLTTHSGSEGVEIAQAYQPDVIVCDMMMPGLNGYEVQALLQLDARTAHIPFIFLTGMVGVDIPEGTPYIAKPFKLADLIQSIQDALV